MSDRSFKEAQYIKIKRAQSKVAVVEWEKLQVGMSGGDGR